MKRMMLAASIVVLTLGTGGMIDARAQGGITGAAKQTGEAVKDTGKAAGQVVTETGKTAADTTKKAATETKGAITHYHAKCADGTRPQAKTQKAANAMCGDHGGVGKR